MVSVNSEEILILGGMAEDKNEREYKLASGFVVNVSEDNDFYVNRVIPDCGVAFISLRNIHCKTEDGNILAVIKNQEMNNKIFEISKDVDRFDSNIAERLLIRC